MLIAAIPIGLVIGLSLGALGGGGSILTVPALVYLLGQSTHGATTASLIIVGVTALAGMVAHLQAHRVRVKAGLVFGVLGVGGSYAGSRLSESVNQHVLLTAFSVLIVIAAASMLRRRQRTATTAASGQDDRPAPAAVAETLRAGGPPVAVAAETRPATRTALATASAISPIRVVAAATVVGLLTGFFGVGGGFVVVPALVLALGFEMPIAVGTSLLVIAINSASALASRLSSHTHLNVALLVTFTLAAIVGTVAGSRVASRTKPEKLIGAFALLLIAVAIYTGARSIPHLI